MSFTLERIRSRRPRSKEEASFQVHLIAVLRARLPDDCVVFAIPNGGSRDAREGYNLKLQGLLAGMPDLGIIYQRITYYLECKSQDGEVSKSQRETFPKIQKAGAPLEVVRTVAEALQRIGEWGIPIKATDKWTVIDLFKSEAVRVRRRA